MIPIRSLDPIGAIGNYWADGHLATAEEIRLLQALADATSIAMENVAIFGELERRVDDRTAELEQANREIQELAVTDPLTGLLNRRGFFQIATLQLAAARNNQRTCLVAFVDVDGLKTVNDKHGHVTGDAMLTQVTQALRSVLRADDVLARIGGDEFCAFIVQPPPDGSSLADRLLSQLASVERSRRPPLPPVRQHRHRDDRRTARRHARRLVLAADARMYEHKRIRNHER
ncbi:GGDEF domain-containing protein [Aeromicrobium sp. UC242_57]|uniref:GGDEF domain-containing protein n=1 Tax=Aeromicrobium sp. UC242_57 TaxID=3374624 RepID=UPI0037A2FE95